MDIYKKAIQDSEKIKLLIDELNNRNITAINIHKFQLNTNNPLLNEFLMKSKEYEMIGCFIRRVDKRNDIIQKIKYNQNKLKDFEIKKRTLNNTIQELETQIEQDKQLLEEWRK
jgi:hypothetical protein